MSMESWQVAFEDARAAVGEADERFQAADLLFSRRLAEKASRPIEQVDHDRWVAAKDALDQAHAAWTVIARTAPIAPAAN